MSLTRRTRRSGFTLVILGVLGAGFFWLTDPRYGPQVSHVAPIWYDPRHWLTVLRGSPGNLLDAANESAVATFIGLAGSALILLVGLWLTTRRTV